jgi:hypothetical protein
MKIRRVLLFLTLFSVMALAVMALAGGGVGAAQPDIPHGIYRGVSTAVKFDISPPLRDLAPAEFTPPAAEIPERATGLEGPLGPQDVDPLVQTAVGSGLIPGPIISFNGPPNISNVSPPDPVGDVGPNHYVAMSNLSFQIFDKAGNSLYGPAFNNTLWAGFGGDCQTDNSGDPIVLHDQIADRWMLSQFTASGPTYFNCVAVSQTPDPTGPYYRWAFSTGTNFPDYPKYGFWPDALYISTREFAGATFAGVGAYAVKRSDLISGNPAAQVISFVVTPASAGGAYNIGDGLLPADVDGSTCRRPPPQLLHGLDGQRRPVWRAAGCPDPLEVHRRLRDARQLDLPLANTIPIAAYDTIFPCSPGTAIASRSRGHQQGRHPVLSPASDAPPGLPQLRHSRIAGHQPVGRGGAEYGRHPVVGGPQSPTARRSSTRKAPTPPVPPTASTAGWAAIAMDGSTAIWPWATVPRRHGHLSQLVVHWPPGRRPAGHHAPRRRPP